MSLLNSDLFVIQRIDSTNGNVPGHYKLTGQNLKEYIAAGDTVVYKGTRDFANAAVDPVTDGTGVNTGDVYINSNPVAGATGAWSADILGEEVNPGDRAIWNGTKWDLIHDQGDAGVTNIIPEEPITVDNSTPNEPVVGVNDALETSAALPQGRTSRKGVVTAIATASDVVAAAGQASPNPEAVVPADLLKATNDDVVALDARVTVNEGDIVDIKGDIVDINTEIGNINTEIGNINTEIDGINVNIENIANGGTLSALKGDDPIEVTTALVDDTAVEGDPDFGKTETTVSIKDATTVQKGAVQLQEVGSAVATSTTVAATPGYVDAYYLIKNFASLGDA